LKAKEPANPHRVIQFVAHGKPVIRLALKQGWRPAARYTNLRDVRGLQFANLGFLDVPWKRYRFDLHVEAVKRTRPFMTVARDVEAAQDLEDILREGEQLQAFCDYVVVVPKDRRLGPDLDRLIPPHMILGYSVPTRYGSTPIPTKYFTRPVHLLGGRPDVQRRLADSMPVVSVDCNRFTLDARFGDFFDGEKFRPHPRGGYLSCLRDSIRNIGNLWVDYNACSLPSRPKVA